MYMRIYCLHVFAMLFTGPFQPDRYVCFLLPKNKSLPSESGFCWALCQPYVIGLPSAVSSSMCPLHVTTRSRARASAAVFSAVLHYPDFPETGNRSQGCLVTVHWCVAACGYIERVTRSLGRKAGDGNGVTGETWSQDKISCSRLKV